MPGYEVFGDEDLDKVSRGYETIATKSAILKRPLPDKWGLIMH
jgi:hypothetical protein